jgi:hypothetical protein
MEAVETKPGYAPLPESMARLEEIRTFYAYVRDKGLQLAKQFTDADNLAAATSAMVWVQSAQWLREEAEEMVKGPERKRISEHMDATGDILQSSHNSYQRKWGLLKSGYQQ